MMSNLQEHSPDSPSFFWGRGVGTTEIFKWRTQMSQHLRTVLNNHIDELVKISTVH